MASLLEVFSLLVGVSAIAGGLAAPSLRHAGAMGEFLVSVLIVGLALGSVVAVRLACRKVLARAGQPAKGPLVVIPCLIQLVSLGIMPVATFFIVQLVLTGHGPAW